MTNLTDFRLKLWYFLLKKINHLTSKHISLENYVTFYRSNPKHRDLIRSVNILDYPSFPKRLLLKVRHFIVKRIFELDKDSKTYRIDYAFKLKGSDRTAGTLFTETLVEKYVKNR